MYDIHGYAGMIYDARRAAAYQKALQLNVTKDSVVVDIGTGLGIFAFMACQAGARKVYAIEPSDVIGLAKEMAALNGFLDRIEFIQGISTEISLPEQADVIVSDLGGALPLFQHHLPSIMDARKRLLKPGGALIPRCDTLWAGVVSAPEMHAKLAPPCDALWGLKMQPAWTRTTNLFTNSRFRTPQLASAPAQLAVFDYNAIEEGNLRASTEWDVTRTVKAHGVGVWFSRILADGVCYSSGPDDAELVYGRLICPWPEPVDLDEGDRVSFEIRADLHSGDYVWSWNTRIHNASKLKATFRQSTFFAEPRSPERLHKQSASYIPGLNDDGERDRLVLQLMDGKNSVSDIAREIHSRFPARFPALEDAIGYVAALSGQYSR